MSYALDGRRALVAGAFREARVVRYFGCQSQLPPVETASLCEFARHKRRMAAYNDAD
jgi:hypothetical protein